MSIKATLDKPIGKILLVLIVVGIWSINFVSFAELSGQTEVLAPVSRTSIDVAQLELPADIDYRYQALRRNPFQVPRDILNQRVEAPKVEEQPVQQEVVLPPLTLNGIVDGTAIIKLHSGEEYIVAKGDTFFQDIVVNNVWTDSVSVTFSKKNFLITFR